MLLAGDGRTFFNVHEQDDQVIGKTDLFVLINSLCE